MTSAWEIRKVFYRSAIESTFRHALDAAAALREPDEDIVALAVKCAEQERDDAHRLRLLGGIAHVLTEADRPGQAMTVLLTALESSRFTDRSTIREVLTLAAQTLASRNEGELLLRICQELDSIDAWFGDEGQESRRISAS
jgi:hypothetical protein